MRGFFFASNQCNAFFKTTSFPPRDSCLRTSRQENAFQESIHLHKQTKKRLNSRRNSGRSLGEDESLVYHSSTTKFAKEVNHTKMQSAVLSRSSIVLHRTVASIRAMRHALDPTVKVGFVPTMGALHQGLFVIINCRLCDTLSFANCELTYMSVLFLRTFVFGRGGTGQK